MKKQKPKDPWKELKNFFREKLKTWRWAKKFFK